VLSLGHTRSIRRQTPPTSGIESSFQILAGLIHDHKAPETSVRKSPRFPHADTGRCWRFPRAALRVAARALQAFPVTDTAGCSAGLAGVSISLTLRSAARQAAEASGRESSSRPHACVRCVRRTISCRCGGFVPRWWSDHHAPERLGCGMPQHAQETDAPPQPTRVSTAPSRSSRRPL
jgi:hypothetical protein